MLNGTLSFSSARLSTIVVSMFVNKTKVLFTRTPRILDSCADMCSAILAQNMAAVLFLAI